MSVIQFAYGKAPLRAYGASKVHLQTPLQRPKQMSAHYLVLVVAEVDSSSSSSISSNRLVRIAFCAFLVFLFVCLCVVCFVSPTLFVSASSSI